MANSIEFEHCFAQLACDLGVCSPQSILYGLGLKNDPSSNFFAGDLDNILQTTGMLDATQCRDIKLQAISLLGEIPEIEGYTLEQLLSVRGFTRLYRARQNSVDREVFLKIINLPDEEDSPALHRFRAEGKILAQLNHHNISGAIDMGETSECLYLVLQNPGGILASEFLQQKKTLSRKHLVTATYSLMQVVRHLHKQQIIHGNISPENVLVQEDGNCSLCGFDYAISNSVEQTSLPVWPVEFTPPPELTRLQADFYACAASIWLMAGGSLHPSPENAALQTSGALAKVKTFPGLSIVLKKMLYPDRMCNYPSAGQILRDLQQVENGIPPEIACAGAATGLTFKAGQKRGRLTIALCICGALLGISAAWFGTGCILTQQAPAEETTEVFTLPEDIANLPRWEDTPQITGKDISTETGKLWMKILRSEPEMRKELLEQFLLKFPDTAQAKVARKLQHTE